LARTKCNLAQKCNETPSRRDLAHCTAGTQLTRKVHAAFVAMTA